ncbi:MAG: hypothetical protein ACJKTH_00140 [Patescibacteria group bacterium UBA2163]
MTFFIDFDRTLFDTYRSYQYLSNKLTVVPDVKELFDEVMLGAEKFNLNNPRRAEVSRELERLFTEGLITLDPGEYAQYVYPDAQKFLDIHGEHSVIVTANRACPSYQKAKLEASGVFAIVQAVSNIPLAGGATKGSEVAALIKKYDGPYFFIDDHDSQLLAVKEECPDVAVYEMRRDGNPGIGSVPTVTSFDELEQLIKNNGS